MCAHIYICTRVCIYIYTLAIDGHYHHSGNNVQTAVLHMIHAHVMTTSSVSFQLSRRAYHYISVPKETNLSLSDLIVPIRRSVGEVLGFSMPKFVPTIPTAEHPPPRNADEDEPSVSNFGARYDFVTALLFCKLKKLLKWNVSMSLLFSKVLDLLDHLCDPGDTLASIRTAHRYITHT